MNVFFVFNQLSFFKDFIFSHERKSKEDQSNEETIDTSKNFACGRESRNFFLIKTSIVSSKGQ